MGDEYPYRITDAVNLENELSAENSGLRGYKYHKLTLLEFIHLNRQNYRIYDGD